MLCFRISAYFSSARPRVILSFRWARAWPFPFFRPPAGEVCCASMVHLLGLPLGFFQFFVLAEDLRLLSLLPIFGCVPVGKVTFSCHVSVAFFFLSPWTGPLFSSDGVSSGGSAGNVNLFPRSCGLHPFLQKRDRSRGTFPPAS